MKHIRVSDTEEIAKLAIYTRFSDLKADSLPKDVRPYKLPPCGCVSTNGLYDTLKAVFD
jgi:hypothetical protein